MSLVNDMLRDLEERHASPAERAALAGLLPADEGAIRRRAGRRRLLLALPLLGLAALAALLLARPWTAPATEAAAPVVGTNVASASVPATPESTAAALPVELPPAAPAPRLLATLPQHGEERFVLQLLLDRAPEYRRSEQSGAVSLRLPHLQLADQGPRAGGFAGSGRSLSWSLLPVDDGVELLLVGLGDELQVFDRLEPVGERWQLWVEVPLAADTFDPAQLPVAGEEQPSARPPVEPSPARPSAALAAGVGAPLQDTPAPARVPQAGAAQDRAAREGTARVSVASHRPEPLAEARQALLAGDRARAIALLEALSRQQPDNREAVRWLARAWLSDGQGERLIAELPAQLARFPADSELRVLLARAQLQAGDGAAAVATLAGRLPPLADDPAYHALLAATYQQTGQWRDSARLYRNLVLLRPTQASWQLGLGIALERLGEHSAAAQHYRQALQGQGLDDASRRYAHERAQALGGES